MAPARLPHTSPPIDIGESGDLLITSDLIATLLLTAATIAALFAVFVLIRRMWKLLLLVAVVIFLAYWLPTQQTNPLFTSHPPAEHEVNP